MSVLIISNDHINALLSWANKNYCPELLCTHTPLWNGYKFSFAQVEHLEMLANIINSANVEDYANSYTEERRVNIRVPFAFSPREYSPVEIVKLCDCAGYNAAGAREITAHIREYAIKQLPGYDKAPWKI